MFIYKSTSKIFIYWPALKMLSCTDSQVMGLSNSLTILIYRNILTADIDIRKVQMVPPPLL